MDCSPLGENILYRTRSAESPDGDEADGDRDGDGLTDDCVLENDLDPTDPDTDDDGTPDGREV